MHETTDAGRASKPTARQLAEPPATDRNRHRLYGWLIAVAGSALLWALIVGVAWTIVAAVT